MSKTKIEWCDYTINPVKGLCPMACSYCYARAMYKRFKWNPEITFMEDWAMPLVRMKPSKIFVGSTIELFGEWIPERWMKNIMETPKSFPRHTFIFLTKQPQNLIKWSPFPSNCWVGVSCSDFEKYGKALFHLINVRAKVKFISFEPLLERITEQYNSEMMATDLKFVGINWIIIGRKTPVSKKTEPKAEWIKEIVEAADKAGVPVFLKNNLKPLLDYYPNAIWAWEDEPVGINPDYFPEPALRQEFSNIAQVV